MSASVEQMTALVSHGGMVKPLSPFVECRPTTVGGVAGKAALRLEFMRHKVATLRLASPPAGRYYLRAGAFGIGPPARLSVPRGLV